MKLNLNKTSLNVEELKYNGEEKKGKVAKERVFKMDRSRYKRGKPYKFSRSQIQNYINCKRCFYLGQRCGLKQPSGPGFSLNIAVDALLKKEMDIYRENQVVPTIMSENGYHYKPFQHKDIELWQNSFKGIQYNMQIEQKEAEKVNITFYGGIDDVFFDEETKELVMIDFKATSKEEDILSLENVFNEGKSYKKQLEIYSWLFQKNGFKVKNKGFLLYYNADKNQNYLKNTMVFKRTVVPIDLDISWIDPTIENMLQCLNSDEIPKLSDQIEKCNDCTYLYVASQILLSEESLQENHTKNYNQEKEETENKNDSL